MLDRRNGAGLARDRHGGHKRATLVRDLLDGQYEDPVRIVAFNTTEGWSRDVTEEIADELQEYWPDLDEIPAYLQDFLERHPSGSKPRPT